MDDHDHIDGGMPGGSGWGAVRRHRVGVASGVAAIAVAGVAVGIAAAGHGSGGTAHPLASPSTTAAAATAPAGPATSPARHGTAAASTAPTAPGTVPTTTASSATAPDDFAEVTAAGVQVRSARTGAVVRTVVPASVIGGRTFAVVGPSGRYVYFTDIDGAGRVPLGGGAVQQLPQPAGPGIVDALAPDPGDTHVEEQLGAADDSAPERVVVATPGSTAVTQLGQGFATGWDGTGTTAYVTTETATAGTTRQVGSPTVTITGVDVADPAHRTVVDSRVSTSPGSDGACGPASTATAAGPGGLVGWAVGGCSTATAGQLTYAFRTVLPGGHPLSLVSATLPRDDWSFYARSLQYTPAGTAVLTLTHQDCGAGDPASPGFAVAVSRGTSGVVTDLPGRGCA